jgi:hypothetical protein
MLVAITIAGSLGSRSTPPAAAPATPVEPGTLSASQPRLEQAALRPAGLPGAYTATPEATVRRLPTLQRCSMLLNPDSLIRAARVADSTEQASTNLTGPARFSELLTTFAGTEGAATLRELQRVTKQCRGLQAALDSRTPVRVRVGTKPIDDPTPSKLTPSS